MQEDISKEKEYTDGELDAIWGTLHSGLFTIEKKEDGFGMVLKEEHFIWKKGCTLDYILKWFDKNYSNGLQKTLF